MIEMERDSLFSILPNLHDLHQLRSFSFDPSIIKSKFNPSDTDESEQATRLYLILCTFYNRVLPRLKYLNINYEE
jgi:hypothetical protein